MEKPRENQSVNNIKLFYLILANTIVLRYGVYATGRVALEAKVLGCEILPYHTLFPDPVLWKVLDNKDAAKILQKKINEIDGVI